MKTKTKIILIFIGSLAFAIAATLPIGNWYFTAMTAIVFTIFYAIKNMWLPSNSPEGSMDIWDILSGALTGIAMAGSQLLAEFATGAELTPRVFWFTIAGAIITYFTKTIPSGQRLEK
jgi:hypothetical protein